MDERECVGVQDLGEAPPVTHAKICTFWSIFLYPQEQLYLRLYWRIADG